MRCDDVKRVVYFFLDGTLTENTTNEFTVHLTLCPECESRTSIHRRLRNFISRRLGRQEAPTHLKVRLTRTIRAFTFE